MEISSESNGDKSYDLTSFAEDIRVSLSATRENDEEKMTLDTSGRGYEKPLANYDRATRCWKMYGDISLWEECPSLETLPPSGIARNGELYPRPRWERITAEIESSSWPTPTTMDHLPPRSEEALLRQQENHRPGRTTPPTLKDAVAYPTMWPTPTATDYKRNGEPSEMRRHSPGLGAMVQKWPTPTAADAYPHALKSSQQTPGSRHSLNLPSAAGGKLNPTWVEWLMGFPHEWTDLKDSETP